MARAVGSSKDGGGEGHRGRFRGWMPSESGVLGREDGRRGEGQLGTQLLCWVSLPGDLRPADFHALAPRRFPPVLTFLSVCSSEVNPRMLQFQAGPLRLRGRKELKGPTGRVCVRERVEGEPETLHTICLHVLGEPPAFYHSAPWNPRKLEPESTT